MLPAASKHGVVPPLPSAHISLRVAVVLPTNSALTVRRSQNAPTGYPT